MIFSGREGNKYIFVKKSDDMPVKGLRQKPVRDKLRDSRFDRPLFGQLVGFLTVAAEVRKLEIINAARVSAFVEGDNVVDSRGHRVRIFQRFINRSAAYPAHFLRGKYALFIALELRPVTLCPVRSSVM